MKKKSLEARKDRLLNSVTMYEVVADHTPNWNEDHPSYATVGCTIDDNQEKHNHTFVVVKNKHIFFCGTCYKGGDIFSYISFINKCSIPDALEYLEKKYA